MARIADDSRSDAARAAPAALAQDGPPEVLSHGELSLPVHDPAVAADAVRALDAEHVCIAGLEVRRPTLDEVFLSLTGRPAKEENNAVPR
ncbi:MAG TPA: hypothetical protein VH231_11275 [Solirubrobacteraceae bacterium]|nr:hypothetical protein [Solirubrobacteraceae bacterium]